MKKIVFFVFLIVIIVSGFYLYNEYKFNKFLKKIESTRIPIDDYYIYGNHLNFSGQTDIKKAKLILKNKNDEIEYNINIDDGKFYLSDKINEGINLDKLTSGKYYILLKANDKYYSFKNNTKYKNLTYYSTIKNNKANKMNINFNKHFTIKSKSVNPKNIYDITIDAGHGGADTGASNGNHYEADYTYEYSIALKKKLESMGYKIKLTRNKNNGIKTYGKNSRTAIPYESHSKLVISIHFNSSEDYISQTGFEIYAPDNSNLDFAYDLAKSLDKNTSLSYSTNKAYSNDKGIYIKNFRQSDIDYMKEQANINGYNYYNITTSTPYLYMIRETGGRITNAFVDGRNTKYEANPYYNSNIGVEAYLLELGYINNYNDLKIIMNEKNNYIKAIANSIDKYMKK